MTVVLAVGLAVIGLVNVAMLQMRLDVRINKVLLSQRSAPHELLSQRSAPHVLLSQRTAPRVFLSQRSAPHVLYSIPCCNRTEDCDHASHQAGCTYHFYYGFKCT